MRASLLTIRPVAESDCRRLWHWTNDPAVRRSAFCQTRIPWDKHVQWFEKKLNDDMCRIYIAENADGVPIGQVRFDRRDDGDAEIDVNVAPDQRGRGYGGQLLIKSAEAYFGETEVPAVHALVKTDNQASEKSFRNAGFTHLGVEQSHGIPVFHFVLKRPR
jgi:RimJ/RimL family protein N-acetyltransferase